MLNIATIASVEEMTRIALEESDHSNNSHK
jgi:hypothetical protein